LETLAEARAEEGDLTKEKILHQLIRQELQRTMFRRIRSILGQFQSKVNAIEVMNADGSWYLVTDKEGIEIGYIQENIRRFTQAANTPPLQLSQTNLIGWTAEGKAAKEILDGKPTFDPYLHPSIQRLAPFLSTPVSVQQKGQLSEEISTEEYIYTGGRKLKNIHLVAGRDYTLDTLKPAALIEICATLINGLWNWL
jgi:hypothetical protein